ncbi:MAG: DUF4386 domain-containing protein [Streptosporangiaceae bacterium]
MNSPKRLARIAGVLYLLVAIFSALAYFVDKKVYVSGDAAATARNVVAHSGLVRAAVVADLVQATGLGLPGDGPVPAAQPRPQERGQRDGGLRRHRGRYHPPQRGL